MGIWDIYCPCWFSTSLWSFPWKMLIFVMWQSLPEGIIPHNTIKSLLNHHFPMFFLWFSYGFPMVFSFAFGWFSPRWPTTGDQPRRICLEPKALRTSCRETLPFEAKVLKACLAVAQRGRKGTFVGIEAGLRWFHMDSSGLIWINMDESNLD